MKKVYFSFVFVTFFLGSMFAQGQQLPNANFNDWSGEKFDGAEQPASWYYSNVTQFGFKFNFAHKEKGRSGQSGDYCMMVQDQALKVAGIGETSPGYIALGTPWVHIPSLTQVSEATAGTYGGVAWKSRPDTLSVWVKRTGDNWQKEDFHVLYYAWKGKAHSNKYKAKNGDCTEVSKDDEESDIRIALDGNECGTEVKGTQICEGWVYGKREYKNWTNLRIPIYYLSSEMPEKMNIIFSASNYPNFRANDNLYVGNSLYVDDAELVYSNKIDQLIIGDKVWTGFDPNSSEEQVYELNKSVTAIPTIVAKRGVGSMTNNKGTTVQFPGRDLSGSELTITKGAIGEVTTLTVVSETNQKRTYKIRFQYPASNNASLKSIEVNGQAISNFKSNIYEYDYDLPYGTTDIPVVTCTQVDANQQVNITQATSVTGTATIVVTAEDKKTKATYTVRFSEAQLSDNTLKDILVNGKSIPGFQPSKTSYRVSLPIDTKDMPTVKAVSAYADGLQTITYTAPSVLDGGVYQISVQTPGNPTAKVYKLTLRLEPSSYAYLADLKMGEDINYIQDFEPEKLNYSVSLPLGTLSVPTITPVPGDEYQKVEVQYGGLNGVSRVNVTAGDGVTSNVYKISVSTETSSITTLKAIYINGEPLAGFDPQVLSYDYDLPLGTTDLPVVTVENGDPYQVVTITYGGLNGITRILVTAGDGSTRLYQIQFHQQVSSNNSLQDILIDGVSLPGFDPTVTEYTYSLEAGTTELPQVTYVAGDEYQTITTRSGGVGGDYKIIVYPQQGSSKTYVIHFKVATSSNTSLAMIYVDGQRLDNFAATTMSYDIELPEGVSIIPTVTVDKAESSQRVLVLLQGEQVLITVTAQSGDKATYTLNFIIHVSANAFLKAIRLDGDMIPNFAPDKLNYEVSYTNQRPKVTVESEEGQQVTMVLPQESGKAYIYVQSQAGGINTYTITFSKQVDNDALLTNIFINGEALVGFQPKTMNYEAHYDGQWPTITWEAAENLTVTSYVQGQTQLLRVASATATNIYSIAFERDWSSNTELSAILLDGEEIASFLPATHEYTIDLAAGSALPQVTFVPKNERQQLTSGATEKNVSSVVVTAEDGSQATYKVIFNVAKYDFTAPISIAVENYELSYQPTTLVYNIAIGTGEELPQVTVVPDKGQSVVIYNESNTLQKVIVTAQSGAQAVYEIRYNRQKSDNALLADILINNQSIAGFRSDKFDYVETLAWRTKFVPCVLPKGVMPTQTITTHYSQVDGVMTIDVLAEDGQAHQTYTIAFPVIKSSNTNLESIAFTDFEFEFNPVVTEYAFELPYGTTAAPQIDSYDKSEPEQQVAIESRPLGDTTLVEVMAENGDIKTYRFSFVAKGTDAPNGLRVLQYRYSRENTPDHFDTISLNVTQYEHVVNLPYGTKTFEVIYAKNYNEQVIFAQAGGTLRPTIIKVQANHTDYEDLTYTITPNVETQNPAVLTGLKVNGTAVSDFDSNRFSYIVNIASSPIVEHQVASFQTGVQVLQQDSKHWQAKVMNDGYTNIYDIWYFYSNDVIPNGEFTNWTTAKYNNAPKPTSWNCVADAVESYRVLSTYKSGDEVVNNGGGTVKLVTPYSSPLGGVTPGMITLGTISGNLGVAGSSSFSISGGISFHNSPDLLTVRYRNAEIKNNSLIEYSLIGYSGTSKLQWTDAQTTNDYIVKTFDLSQANAQAGAPTEMNLTLCSYYVTSGTISAGCTPTMYVDYVRFSYNSQLTALKVNGLDATLTDKAFAVTLTDCEQTRIPTLAFTGQVSDQAQLITWSEENAGVRTATIRNFAEDGTYTDYSLSVTRPLQSSANLQSLLVNGEEISGFDAATHEYTYIMNSAQLPDVDYKAQSKLQTITMNYADSVMTITVTAENGTSQNYTIRMKHPVSSNTQLVAIDGVEDFDPATHEYQLTAEQLPAMNFYKAEDAQTVVMRNGVFTVTAADGSVGTYTVVAQPQPRQSQGLITEFEIDGTIPTDFGGTNYTKTAELPEWVSFVRDDYRDSVVMVQTEKQIQWNVFGTESNIKTYTLSQPSKDVTNTKLSAILVADTLIAGFNADIKDYILVTNSAVQLRAIPIYVEQQVEVTLNDNVYTIEVTASNGEDKATYTVTIKPDLSNEAVLEMIYVGGQELQGFRADSLNYTLILPTPQIKQQELQMPSITYRSGNNATVSMEVGKLGEPTYINVTSEDLSSHNTYVITVEAEPSHNADLSAILINNQPVEHFSPMYAYYSTRVPNIDFSVLWSADDKFLTVTRSDVEGENNVIVNLDTKAQDGTTTRHYEINVYVETFAASATLADIMLNGQPMSEFLPELNPMLAFSPMNNQYTVNLPIGTTILPDVQAVLGQEGQNVTYMRDGFKVQLQVSSKDDAVTNTYTIQYVVPKSSNTLLSNIYVNGEAIEGFNPTTYVYTYTLPIEYIGQQPEVVGQQSEATQIISDAVFSGNKATIEVTAEDLSKAQYVVIFDYQASTVDTLKAIYEDAHLLPGFVATTSTYSITLPTNNRRFPNLDWETGDDYQTVVMDTILVDTYHLNRRITVTAQDGRHRVYEVNYEITKSNVDTLAGLFINDKPLESFSANQTEYAIYVNEGDAQPIITWIVGDEYQQVSMTILPEVSGVKAMNKVIIMVEAENGSVNLYTIHVLYYLDNNAQLKMIRCNGEDLPDFDPERLSYIVVLAKGENYPFIDWELSNNLQRVIETRVEDTTFLSVTAESGNQSVYRLTYKHNLSENAQLSDILLNDESMLEFEPNLYEYHFVVEFGEVLPTVTPIKAEEEQTITLRYDTTYDVQGNQQIVVIIEVLAEETSISNEYFLVFTLQKNWDATLQAIYVKEQELKNFDPLVTDYTLYLPVGSELSDLYVLQDISYKLSDPLATASLSQQQDGSFVISVVAQDGESYMVYTLTQEILLDDNNYLSSITLDGIALNDFTPEQTFYTYILNSGAPVPVIEATAESERAEVSIMVKPVGDTTFILCEAEDMSTRKYYIHFVYSDINEAQTPTSRDVVIKYIPGSTDIVVATIRKDVVFYLFDGYGHRLCAYRLQTANFNFSDIRPDKDGIDTFFDFDAEIVGQRIHLFPNQFYLYAFMEGSKHILKTGKLMAH